ncbi:zinc-binding dehydrogenase, partial [Streptomyces sp. NPDC001709]
RTLTQLGRVRGRTGHDSILSGNRASIRPGALHGGAGGIGTTAIQIAKAHGARVVTTVGGPEQAARVRELGADLAINYHTEDFAEHVPYDVILDVIGGDYLPRNVKSLALDGRLVIIGLQNSLTAELNHAELLAKRASVHGTTLRSRQAGQKAAIVAEVQEHVWPTASAKSSYSTLTRHDSKSRPTAIPNRCAR